MRLKAGDRLDRFEILEPLGEGAYAETYKARDTKTGELVLIKSPNPLLFADPAIHQRFMREAEIARHLNHPGVQRSVDLGDKRSEPYLAMEYIEGDTLRRWMRGHKMPLPVHQAVAWGRELAEALQYLHQHKIVHRDLKPENVIVTGAGHLKIIDFGTALLAGARRLTWRHLTEALGTPDYMSPEQIQGERGDPRSDLYSWGIMMYEFLTGRVPFEGDNWLAVMAGHLQRDPRRIRELRPEVTEDLETVVLTAMRRYPENRYQSADELLADLAKVRVSEAPAAAPAAPAPSLPPLFTPAPSPAGGGVGAGSGPGPGGGVRPAVPTFGSPRGGAGGSSYRGGGSFGGAGGSGGSSRRSLPAQIPPPASPPSRAAASAGPIRRDLTPEKPIGRLPAPASQRGLWMFVGAIAGGFVLLVALIIILSKAL